MKLLVLIVAVVMGAGVWAAHPKGADKALTAPALQPPSSALQGPLTVAVIGTSLTADAAWPEQAAARLQDCYPDSITLRRLAQGGQTSTWGLANLAQMMDAPPDIALIEFTINDADIRRGVSVTESARNHRALVTALRAANPDVQIILLRLNRAYGLRAMLRPRLSVYEENLAQIAELETVGLLDLRPDWAHAGKAALTDGIHPSTPSDLAITLPPVLTRLGQITGHPCGG